MLLHRYVWDSTRLGRADQLMDALGWESLFSYSQAQSLTTFIRTSQGGDANLGSVLA